MTSMWKRVHALEGQRLRTTGHDIPFDVVSVDEDKVTVEVGEDRKPYTINRRQFERAEELGLVTGDAIPDQLNKERIASGRTAYAAAILRAIVRQAASN